MGHGGRNSAGAAGDLYKTSSQSGPIGKPKALLPLTALPAEILFERARNQADLTATNPAAIELFKRHTIEAEDYQAGLLKLFLQAKNRSFILAGCGLDFDSALENISNSVGRLRGLLLAVNAIRDPKNQEALFTEATRFAGKPRTFPVAVVALSFYQGKVAKELFEQALILFKHKKFTKKSTSEENKIAGIKCIAHVSPLLNAKQWQRATEIFLKEAKAKDNSERLKQTILNTCALFPFNRFTASTAAPVLALLLERATSAEDPIHRLESERAIYKICSHLDKAKTDIILQFVSTNFRAGANKLTQPKNYKKNQILSRALEKLPFALTPEQTAALPSEKLVPSLSLAEVNLQSENLIVAIKKITAYPFISHLTPERLQIVLNKLLALSKDSKIHESVRRFALTRLTQIAPLVLTATQLQALISELAGVSPEAEQMLKACIPEDINTTLGWDIIRELGVTLSQSSFQAALETATTIARHIHTRFYLYEIESAVKAQVGHHLKAAFDRALLSSASRSGQREYTAKLHGAILRQLPAPLALECWLLNSKKTCDYFSREVYPKRIALKPGSQFLYPLNTLYTIATTERLAVSDLLRYIPSTTITAEQIAKILESLTDMLSKPDYSNITVYGESNATSASTNMLPDLGHITQQLIVSFSANIARMPYHTLTDSQLPDILTRLIHFHYLVPRVVATPPAEFESSIIAALQAMPFHSMQTEKEVNSCNALLHILTAAVGSAELKLAVEQAKMRMPIPPRTLNQTALTKRQLKSPLVVQTQKQVAAVQEALKVLPDLLMEAKAIAGADNTPTLEHYLEAASKHHNLTEQLILDVYPWLSKNALPQAAGKWSPAPETELEAEATSDSETTAADSDERQPSPIALTREQEQRLEATFRRFTNHRLLSLLNDKTTAPNVRGLALNVLFTYHTDPSREHLQIIVLEKLLEIDPENVASRLAACGIDLKAVMQQTSNAYLKLLIISLLLKKAAPEEAKKLLALLPGLAFDKTTLKLIGQILQSYHVDKRLIDTVIASGTGQPNFDIELSKRDYLYRNVFESTESFRLSMQAFLTENGDPIPERLALAFEQLKVFLRRSNKQEKKAALALISKFKLTENHQALAIEIFDSLKGLFLEETPDEHILSCAISNVRRRLPLHLVPAEKIQAAINAFVELLEKGQLTRSVSEALVELPFNEVTDPALIERTCNVLLAGLQKPDSEERTAAAEALANMFPEIPVAARAKAITALLKLPLDPDTKERTAAAKALAIMFPKVPETRATAAAKKEHRAEATTAKKKHENNNAIVHAIFRLAQYFTQEQSKEAIGALLKSLRKNSKSSFANKHYRHELFKAIAEIPTQHITVDELEEIIATLLPEIHGNYQQQALEAIAKMPLEKLSKATHQQILTALFSVQKFAPICAIILSKIPNYQALLTTAEQHQRTAVCQTVQAAVNQALASLQPGSATATSDTEELEEKNQLSKFYSYEQLDKITSDESADLNERQPEVPTTPVEEHTSDSSSVSDYSDEESETNTNESQSEASSAFTKKPTPAELLVKSSTVITQLTFSSFDDDGELGVQEEMLKNSSFI